MKERKFLDFIELPNPTGKTKKFLVQNTNEESLGYIKWRSGWRKYVFETIEAVYDEKCLLEVIKFLKELMDERKLQS